MLYLVLATGLNKHIWSILGMLYLILIDYWGARQKNYHTRILDAGRFKLKIKRDTQSSRFIMVIIIGLS